MTRVVFPVWVGEIGQKIYNEYWEKYNITPEFDSCLYFDGVHIATVLDYIINRGQDYTDPLKLMSTIRVAKSNGCTGPISIDPESNDRLLLKEEGLCLDILFGFRSYLCNSFYYISKMVKYICRDSWRKKIYRWFYCGGTIPIDFFEFASMGLNFSEFGSILSN
ncbi:unnamed protein product [Blepharisma stoltei]|uniref:Uncharacterized protein n=1 Tax=Blepharisma stoltei TaxID=1481888 RepID=A0AAU9KCW9_9CILI|nr:unnamed protein product [Blepharisma stoltei]